MRPYQLQGLNWMVSLHHNGLNGILADEMVRPNSKYTPQIDLLFACRVLGKPYSLSHFLPTSSTTGTSPALILSSFQNPLCKIGHVNSKNGPLISRSFRWQVLRTNERKSSPISLYPKTSKYV